MPLNIRLKPKWLVDRVRWYALQKRLHCEEALVLLVTEALDRCPEVPQNRPPGMQPPKPNKVEGHATRVLFQLKQAADSGAGPLTIKDLVATTPFTPTQVRYALQQLLEEEAIVCEKARHYHGRGRAPFVYSLVKG